MKKFSLALSQQQLQVLNDALVALPFKVAAPLIQHINAEIQRQHEAWGDTRTSSGATIPPEPTED